MKKILLALVVIAVIFLVTYKLLPKKNGSEIVFTSTTNSLSYTEYSFDSGDDLELSFTKRFYEKLRKSQTLLDAGSGVIKDNEMRYSPVSEQDISEGVISRYTWDSDRYELIQKSNQVIAGSYRMLLNGELLFEQQMDFGADGPIEDWRIVNNKPAFTFYSSCDVDKNNHVSCNHDIWYDGGLVSKKFAVQNPRYLFFYNNKIGFIASNNGVDKVFYDGKFITPGFDTIWTHNCCSYTEILPTVYENGILLFYAKRNETTYLVETQLQ